MILFHPGIRFPSYIYFNQVGVRLCCLSNSFIVKIIVFIVMLYYINITKIVFGLQQFQKFDESYFIG